MSISQPNSKMKRILKGILMKQYYDTMEYMLSEETDLVGELRQRAKEIRDEVFSDPASTAEDRKKAEDILKFTTIEEYYKEVPRSTVFGIFHYLRYKFPGESTIVAHSRMYDKLMDEVNRKYILINPESLK